MRKYKSYSIVVIAALVVAFTAGFGCRHGDRTPPTVSFVNPENNATDEPINRKITATFSEPMDILTITTATFTLSKGATAVPGTVTYTDTTATFTAASDLDPNTVYTAQLTTRNRDHAGNQLQCPYVWSFTTGTIPDAIPPTVMFTTPGTDETAVAFNAPITATFSEAMDPATFTTATFTLFDGTTAVPGSVIYVGFTAVFTPAIDLDPDTQYTATITTGATDLAANALESAYVWSFTTGALPDTTAPTVSFVAPENHDTAVPVNTKIAATFSEAMDPLTITTATFTLKQGATPVPGTVVYAGITATFTPSSNLATSTVYTATITTEATDLAGNRLESAYVWSFTTGTAPDTMAPTVSFVAPLNLATAVPVNTKIAATFSEAMDPLAITKTTFTLMQGATPVPGTVVYAGITATFTPASNLADSTLYTATITTAARDLAGNTLASDYVWSFTTGTIPDTTAPTVSFVDPANLATAVPVNTKIAATFSEAMDPLTVTTATFTVKNGSTPVTGTVVYAGITATFTPAGNLTTSTLYTATITTVAKDLAGNALAVNKVWSFTTGVAPDTTAPTVNSTNPGSGTSGIAVNSKIAAVFSEAMNPLTITPVTFTLTQEGTPAAGTVIFSGLTGTFTPGADLLYSTLYTATITTGAKDLAGNALAVNKVWSFTTGAAPDTTPPTVISTNPADTDTSVALNKKITATFSEAMDHLTITTATFTLAQGGTPVAGTVILSGVTATFTPDADLAPSTVYTATITTGAKDLANNALAANKVWSFTTGTQAAQTVIQDPVPLGSCSTFAILASAAITNIPTSDITGNVGLTPDAGSNITGFSSPGTCPEVTGIVYAVDGTGPGCATIAPTILTNAKAAALTAFDNARAAVRGTPQAISGNLNGLTLYPGLYESGTSLEISAGGHLYLDAQGDSNAIFVIRSATTITTEATSQVVLTKAAKASNVYWTAGSAVTLGTNSIMKGTMIAGTALTLLDQTNLEGRALNQGPSAAEIKCNACTITVPAP